MFKNYSNDVTAYLGVFYAFFPLYLLSLYSMLLYVSNSACNERQDLITIESKPYIQKDSDL